MSNAVNDNHREMFSETLERVGLCPYCGSLVSIEPTGLCCGEVHGELGYETEQGERFLESEYEEHYQAWLSKRGEP